MRKKERIYRYSVCECLWCICMTAFGSSNLPSVSLISSIKITIIIIQIILLFSFCFKPTLLSSLLFFVNSLQTDKQFQKNKELFFFFCKQHIQNFFYFLLVFSWRKRKNFLPDCTKSRQTIYMCTFFWSKKKNKEQVFEDSSKQRYYW